MEIPELLHLICRTVVNIPLPGWKTGICRDGVNCTKNYSNTTISNQILVPIIDSTYFSASPPFLQILIEEFPAAKIQLNARNIFEILKFQFGNALKRFNIRPASRKSKIYQEVSKSCSLFPHLIYLYSAPLLSALLSG